MIIQIPFPKILDRTYPHRIYSFDISDYILEVELRSPLKFNLYWKFW